MPSSVALFVTGASTGLLAGGASCAAVQGGLLAGAVARRSAGPAASPSVSTCSTSGRAPGQRPQAASRGGAGGGHQHAAAATVAPTSTSLAPVAAFLAGKLVSHTLLGVLLGVFGAGLQPSPRARAVLLLAAGALMVFFALDLFGVKAVGRLVPRPPAAFGRLVRRTSRTGSTLTAPLLGFATVLVPCGVTLSVELIAITSGSPVAGAAVMAGFVLGTAPLFTGLGYLFRRTSQALSGRLGIATGLVVLVIAVWTVTSGLRAGGWVPAASGGEAVAAPAAAAGPAAPGVPGRQVVTITVTDSYTPKNINARAGVPTTLVLHGQDASGCVRAFTIPARGIQQIVDSGQDTAIDLGTPQAGALRFSCAMGMDGGTITFQGGTR